LNPLVFFSLVLHSDGERQFVVGSQQRSDHVDYHERAENRLDNLFPPMVCDEPFNRSGV
jgi:hypothetical protein